MRQAQTDLPRDLALTRQALSRMEAPIHLRTYTRPGSPEYDDLSTRTANEAIVARVLLATMIETLDREEEGEA